MGSSISDRSRMGVPPGERFFTSRRAGRALSIDASSADVAAATAATVAAVAGDDVPLDGPHVGAVTSATFAGATSNRTPMRPVRTISFFPGPVNTVDGGGGGGGGPPRFAGAPAGFTGGGIFSAFSAFSTAAGVWLMRVS